jgi:glycosyltransferase involved in cell wall biosynthesis
MNPRVSVIIPAYNEEQYIAQTLETLVSQTTAVPFEVIVVDNASTDRTAAVAEGFRDRLDIRVIREPKKGRGAARAAGHDAARGELLFSCDADGLLPHNWITTMVDALDSHPEIIAVTGSPEVRDLAPWRNGIFNVVMPLFIRLSVLWQGNVGISGFSCAIRRDAYTKAGGFDPESDACEDLELAMRLRPLGKILFLSSPRVVVSGRRFRRGLVRAWTEYLGTYWRKFILKKPAILSDVK